MKKFAMNAKHKIPGKHKHYSGENQQSTVNDGAPHKKSC